MREQCPDTEQLGVYLEHKMSAEATASMEAHFAKCRTCRQIIASVIRSESEVPDPILPQKT